MTNLEYLAKFLEETFGAICFHNDPEDGYVAYTEKDGKEMETLAVYFPNELDLQDKFTAERLTRKAGKDFYKRYVGARGIRLHPMMGNMIFSRYIVGGRTIGIFGFPLVSDERAMLVMQYFLGRNIDNRIFDKNQNYKNPLPTNNGFCFLQGANIKATLEKFLTENNLPLVNEENGFYISPFLSFLGTEKKDDWKELFSYFGDAEKRRNDLVNKRREISYETLKNMTKAEWKDFFEAQGFKPIPKSEFDD